MEPLWPSPPSRHLCPLPGATEAGQAGPGREQRPDGGGPHIPPGLEVRVTGWVSVYRSVPGVTGEECPILTRIPRGSGALRSHRCLQAQTRQHLHS